MSRAWILLALLSGCASGGKGAAPSFRRVDDPKSIPGLAAWASDADGHHYVLDHLPKNAQTLETGFRYLATQTDANRVREPLAGSRTVYGAELSFENRRSPKGTWKMFAYSRNADFTGDVVFAMFGPEGSARGVYLGARNPGEGARPPRFVKADAKDVAGLVDRIKSRIGRDFVLDRFPEATRTLEEGFRYLAVDSTRDLTGKALRAEPVVHGAEIVVESQGEAVKVFLYSPSPTFNRMLIYALQGADGKPQGVFRHPD